MYLLIDNYDSFTYNLVQDMRSLGASVDVVANDKIDIAGIAARKPEGLVFSPGPGNPDSAGITLAAIKAFAGKMPMLGICLGHQSIAQAFGGRIVRAKKLMHGKTSRIRHDGKGIFAGLPQNFEAMRYHSLAVERESLPDCFEISAEAEDGEIMGLRHKTLPIESVQYHPESVGTPEGIGQLRNFLGLGNTAASADEAQSYRMFLSIMEGRMPERELADLLTRDRGRMPSAAELAGAARAMREVGVKVDISGVDAVDIVGTGGDGLNTFNVSTTAAFIAAGAGVVVAKHGNVAATSKCGAADVLGALGLDLSMRPDHVAACIREVGVGFLFAKSLHPAMKFAAPVRKALGFRTIFNLLGPLTNPAGVKRHVIGVYDPRLAPVMAETLKLLGSERAYVVSGSDGLDEIGPSGLTFVSTLRDGGVSTGLMDAASLYGESFPTSAIGGGDAAENAKLLLAVLSGEDHGARRAAAVENAAATILAAGKADTALEAIDAARASIDSGRALAKLKAMVAFK
jgi:anthranilate synthase/phosphoribosyltransferase